jgi:hypothetical protein
MSMRSLPFDKVTIVGETDSNTGVLVLLDDTNGANLISCAATAVPSGKAGYNKGCLLIETTNGYLYQNTASVTSCTFTLRATGTSGASGAAGSSGVSGGVGTSGVSGAVGTSGATGASGASGKSGTSGLTGA